MGCFFMGERVMDGLKDKPVNLQKMMAKELNKQFTDAVCLDMWNLFIKSEQLKKK